MEESLEQIFQPTLYNWSCYKNSVFRKPNPNPEIHWHFIPRYQDPVYFEGIEFHDPDFGYIPRPEKREIPPKAMKKLAIKLKKQFYIQMTKKIVLHRINFYSGYNLTKVSL
nr:hypothetical protein [Methanobacterium formicicum]